MPARAIEQAFLLVKAKEGKNIKKRTHACVIWRSCFINLWFRTFPQKLFKIC